MSQFPTFRRGDTEHDWRAIEMQHFVNRTKRLDNISGGDGIDVLDTPGGVRIELAGSLGSRVPATIVVQLVEEPVEDDKMLTVKRVDYAAMPPSQGEYEIDQDGFEAYPDIGFKAVDYADYFDDGPPNLEVTFLRAYWRRGVWLVEMPAPDTPSDVKLQQFKVQTNTFSGEDDCVGVALWDGVTLGEENILIARPWMLRKSPFHDVVYNNIRYTYESFTERVATGIDDETLTETQVIVPQYRIDDVIYAVRPWSGGTGVTVLEGDELVPIKWLDVNVDGRAWARRYEYGA